MSEFDVAYGRLEGWLLAMNAPQLIRDALDIATSTEKSPYKAIEPLPDVNKIQAEANKLMRESPSKPRKSLSEDNRKALIDRLAAARESRLEKIREAKKNT